MRLPTAVLAAALVAALATAGCQGGQGPPPQRDQVYWLKVGGRDLNCPGNAVGLVNLAQYAIVDNTAADYFLLLRCTAPGGSGQDGDQLEVFSGAAGYDQPKRLGVMVYDWAHQRLSPDIAKVCDEVFARAASGSPPAVWAASSGHGGSLVVRSGATWAVSTRCPVKSTVTSSGG